MSPSSEITAFGASFTLLTLLCKAGVKKLTSFSLAELSVKGVSDVVLLALLEIWLETPLLVDEIDDTVFELLWSGLSMPDE